MLSNKIFIQSVFLSSWRRSSLGRSWMNGPTGKTWTSTQRSWSTCPNSNWRRTTSLTTLWPNWAWQMFLVGWRPTCLVWMVREDSSCPRWCTKPSWRWTRKVQRQLQQRQAWWLSVCWGRNTSRPTTPSFSSSDTIRPSPSSSLADFPLLSRPSQFILD